MSTKIFQYFPLLPSELRMMMIDEMEPEDRCRFTRCSRSCSNAAKNSKKYIEELNIDTYGEMDGGVTVVYKQEPDFTQHGYRLNTEEVSGMKYIKYSSLQTSNEIWRMEMNSSKDAMKYVVEVFTNLLHSHQNIIKKIDIFDCLEYPFSGNFLKNVDFGIKQLNNLESLTTVIGIDIKQFISKVRKPLKELQCSEEASDTIMPYFDQISQVQYNLFISNLKLSYDQLLKLSARRIFVHIGEMTENDICNFITSWKNGKNRSNMKTCGWELKESHFDVGKLFQMLGGEFNNTDYDRIDIKHNKEAGKRAELCYLEDGDFSRWISFEVIKSDGTSSS